jgi:DNA polymerase
MDQKKSLAVLRKEWSGCTRCAISKLRSADDRVVLGGGAIPADYLFVYDAPESDDMAAGFPLQGRHGGILENLIYKAEFPKDSFGFAPLVGCWPYTILPATEDQPEQVRDRDPTTAEVEACLPRIQRIIYTVDPRLIFAVGDVAWKTLVKPKDRDGETTLGKAAGGLFWTVVPGRLRQIRYPVMPLLSPKKIIDNPSAAEHGPIAITMEAMMRAQKYVNMIKKEEKQA